MGKNEDKNKENKSQRNITRNKQDKKTIQNDSVNVTRDDNEGKDNSVKENRTKDNNRNKKIYTGIICACVLIGIMFFCAKRYDDIVYPNVKLYDNNVSKLDNSQLNIEVDNTVNFIKENTISVNIEDKKYDIRVGDLISDFNEGKTKKDMFTYGKDSNFLEQFGLITLSVKRNYNFEIKINYDEIKNKVNKIYKDSTVATVEPTVTIEGEEISVTEGKDGKAIDKDKLSDAIIGAILSNDIGKTNIVLNEKYKITKPKTDVASLKEINAKISSATTYFGGTGSNRGLNIANAANFINNTVLLPGEEFSYEDAVSPVELSNGYYMAPVIVSGTHKDAPGGGVCQVSSTLYNAELKAGIIPTERYNHSKSVSYVQKGLDATLATGSKNLRFKNPYDYPILIHAYTVGGQLTVEIWSKEGILEGKEYTPVSFVKGNVANTYLYEYNSKGELVEKRFLDTSIYG